MSLAPGTVALDPLSLGVPYPARGWRVGGAFEDSARPDLDVAPSSRIGYHPLDIRSLTTESRGVQAADRGRAAADQTSPVRSTPRSDRSSSRGGR